MTKKYVKNTRLEIVSEEVEGYIVQNEGEPSDQWFIDMETFNKTYTEDVQDFGWAVRMLKAGYKVARVGWNGKGMFLYYVPPGSYPARTKIAKTIGDFVDYGAYIAMKTAQGNVVPWLASQTDMLAEDWVIVE